MFIIETRTTKSILCTDGEFRAPSLVGPAGWSPKMWKTFTGARNYAAERWNSMKTGQVNMVELDDNGCVKRDAAA